MSLFVLLVIMAEPLGAESPRTPGTDSVAVLIRQLGDDDYDSREKAARGLLALGEEALPALRRAAADEREMLEIQRRAEGLVNSIMETLRKGRNTGTTLRFIPSGEFLMGSPDKERGRQADETQHRVKLTRTFLLGVCEVNQEEYVRVKKTNPSYFQPRAEGKDKVAKQDTARFPVERVSWYDAIDFCNRLSQLDGFEPYYKVTGVTHAGTSIATATVTVMGGNGYRLPTEAEWEYACRAGTATRFHYGSFTSSTKANLKYSTPGVYGTPGKWHAPERTEKVGTYPANALELHDMHGNVAEWCWDYYDAAYYTRSPLTDPLGPEKNGVHRVVRGGSWLVGEDSGRSASRFWHVPGEGAYFIGFRVARAPK